MDETNNRISTGVGVLDRSMAVLNCFSSGSDLLGAKDIADRCGMTVPTTYRLIHAMVEHELLEKSGSRYQLGIGLLRLGNRMAEGIEIRHKIRPHLVWLSGATGENAGLHVRRGNSRISVDIVKGDQFIRPITEAEVGQPLPLHAGSAGKILLAWLQPTAEAIRLARESAEDYGTEFDEGDFADRLVLARQRGWLDSEAERAEGVVSISAPVFDSSGEVAASIVVSALFTRLPREKRPEVADLVMDAANRASRTLGYEGSISEGVM